MACEKQPQAFPRLFESFRIGNVELQNRLVALPHGTSMIKDGAIMDADIAYYEERAKSGLAMIITGAAVVSRTSYIRSGKLVAPYDEAVFESLQKRVDAVHRHGTKIVGQILHLGRETIGGEFENAPLAPSVIRSPRDPYGPKKLNEKEILEIVEAFGISAANLKATGHDGVEIHGAHGYLVGQFLSEATNVRDDRWGGSLENRMRFLRMVIESIRKHCGEDFMLGLRLSASEEIADGMEIPDAVQISKLIAADELTDYLSITMGTRGLYVEDATQPKAIAARAAGLIRQATGLPVIVGQRINSPEIAEKVLAEGQADMIGMARAFIADADWVTKARAGQSERIRPCVGLNQECRAFSPHLHCAVNPRAGRELVSEFTIKGPLRKRRIAIIGGGPGGLETARAAADRDHQVTIFEATDGLGGLFLYAASLPGRSDLRNLIDYLQSEIRRLCVTVELNRRIESASELGGFDVAVIATGSQPNPLSEEQAGPHVRTWFEVLDQEMPAPHGLRRATVIDDGSAFWWTYGVAEALMNAGWKVTIASPGVSVAGQIPTESIGPLIARLGSCGTEYRVLSILDRITGNGVSLMNGGSGETTEYECELVVIQTGRTSLTALIDALEESTMEVHSIGDCVSPRRVSQAILEGQRLGLSL